MAKKDGIEVLFPVGRLVQGNLYTPKTTDALGQPLVVKSGPNKGQPRVDYFFSVAIKKEPGHTHWASTEWGQKIWAFAHQAWPGGQTQRPDFAWKIEDGDSIIPNKNNKKPCDQEGWSGHWIVRLGGGFAPGIWNSNGSAKVIEENAVKPGYFVQVFANISSNNSDQTAGIYINHRIVALAAYGPEITFGPDAAAVGFGQGALPPGASSVPLGAMTPPATGAAPLPPGAPSASIASPPVPGAVATPPPVPAAAPSTAAVAPQPTPPPSTTFTANAAGVPPPPTPAQPQRVMLPAAGGVPYEQWIANSWTDELLIQHGKMQAA